MHLESVPVDEDKNLIPLIEKIGRAVKFEYLSEDGRLVSSEGIIENVTEYGITINLFNPLHTRSLYALTFDDGLPKYFPFKGREMIVRIMDKRYEDKEFTEAFINSVENIRPPIQSILEA